MEYVNMPCIRICTIILSVSWGFFEGRAAGKNRSAKTGGKNSDRWSFVIIYAAISLGFSGGYILSFSHVGEIVTWFPFVSAAGFLLGVAGLVVRISAMRILNDYFTHTVQIIEGHEIVRTGFYRYIRHPSYSGQLLILLGFGVMLSNWASLLVIFLPFFFAIMHRISIEEKTLVLHFGDRYRDYIKETKRFIPGIW